MNTLREIFDRHAHETDNWNNDLSFEGFQQAIADYEASKWKTDFPDLLTHQGESHSVIAEVEGYKEPLVMRALFLKEDDGYIVWARVYDGIDGDAIHDDQYNVIRWTEIPTPPTKQW